jgi:hypothetical protein
MAPWSGTLIERRTSNRVVDGTVADALDQIVTDGPAMFDQGDVAILLQTALDGIAAIQHLGCRPL